MQQINTELFRRLGERHIEAARNVRVDPEWVQQMRESAQSLTVAFGKVAERYAEAVRQIPVVAEHNERMRRLNHREDE